MKRSAAVGIVASVLSVMLIASCRPHEQEAGMLLAPKAEATEMTTLPSETEAAKLVMSDYGKMARNSLMTNGFYISELFSDEEETEYVIDFPKDAVGFMAVSSNMRTSLAYIELSSSEQVEEVLESVFRNLENDESQEPVALSETLSVYTYEEDGTSTHIIVDNANLSILFLYDGEIEDKDIALAFKF